MTTLRPPDRWRWIEPALLVASAACALGIGLLHREALVPATAALFGATFAVYAGLGVGTGHVCTGRSWVSADKAASGFWLVVSLDAVGATLFLAIAVWG